MILASVGTGEGLLVISHAADGIVVGAHAGGGAHFVRHEVRDKGGAGLALFAASLSQESRPTLQDQH